jgi:hypothetical protein
MILQLSAAQQSKSQGFVLRDSQPSVYSKMSPKKRNEKLKFKNEVNVSISNHHNSKKNCENNFQISLHG